MAETVNKGKKIFADKIRMLAKSIYDAADDIAGTTDGCVEIEVSFTIDTETENSPELPQYEIVRRHYPERQLIDDFIRMRGASETEEKRPVLSIDSDPVAYKEMLDKEIERAKTTASLPYPQLTCRTCIYGDEDDSIYCATCTRNKDFVSHIGHTDNWRVR